MHATTVAVDLAKSVFQIAVVDDKWKVVEQFCLTRSQFERWFHNRAVGLVIMEACGSAHHWGRWFNRQGIEVKLLPAAYIRAYVKSNKTDAADACALLEAARCADIVPVRVKSVEQQALQGLHRIRSRWMGTRTARINTLRGFCREFGLTPKEFSSGNSCKLGRISKKGDRYLRMLLTHGARAVLRASELARRTGKPLDGLRTWATEIQERTHHNKAACALANKLARVCYAVLRDHTPFGSPQPRQEKKLTRMAFAIAA